MLSTANFNFIGNLNDFLPGKQQYSAVKYSFNDHPAVKDAIEAIGVPHVEIDKIVVDSLCVGFYYQLTNADNIQVYPKKEAPANSECQPLIPTINTPVKFVADVHLGKLVKLLRTLGIDVLYENNYADKAIVDIAFEEGRVVLTRDVALLKHKVLKWGYWLRSQKTEVQLEEVISRFSLDSQIKPFSRCLECNGLINPVQKKEVMDKLLPETIKVFNEFYQCLSCHRVYWKGSHFERMKKLVERFTT